MTDDLGKHFDRKVRVCILNRSATNNFLHIKIKHNVNVNIKQYGYVRN